MVKFRAVFIGCCLLILFALVGGAAAQAESPGQLGAAVREALFDAQGALMGGDTDIAVVAVQSAIETFSANLRPTIADASPDTAERLDEQLAIALSAAEMGDSLTLAEARGRIWTGLLEGSAAVVFNALEEGDALTARRWLTLRDYRPSTRFSRPGADATLAINALAAGEISPEAALTATRIDLLDTYQAQLNASLTDADEADSRDFAMRRAEESGLAAGYFAILSAAYRDQLGEDALTVANTAFNALAASAAADDDAAFANARARVTGAVTGFRAAPLSDEEAARRAGQLLRFIALVPVEYGRGVRNGEVISDLEIQEALTFREGAVAAFTDLQGALMALDAEATARVSDLLALTAVQIRDVVEPAELENSVSSITGELQAIMPAAWLSANAASDMDVIYSVLDAVETAIRSGQYPQAESARLEAYALLEMGMEQRLRGFAPDLAARVEGLFWQGTDEQTGLATLIGLNAPANDVLVALNALRAALADGQVMIESARSAPAAVAGNAAIIVFREGLEAVLILASLLASLRTVQEKQFRRPIVMGAALALAATAVTWVVANQLLVLMLPLGEKLEAIVSLIAIGVLLLITNWFFHKVYWTGWMANFHQRKKRLIGGIAVVTISQAAGLIILGFTSIYREGFETVLFLQSLVLEAGISVVLQGVLLGCVGVVIVGFITFSLQVRLPYKKMLIVTGVMIGFVLVAMVGNTVHVMQSIGWLPITPIPGLNLPFWMGQWFGVYATVQGIGLQILAAAFVIGSYYLAEHQQKVKRLSRRGTAQAANSAKTA